jgi:biopolymer transport protein ExbD
MKIISPLPHRKGRLEIIPLIDIMFFLLAAFMVVSIGKIHVKSLKISLPTNVPTAQKETKEDFLNISVNEQGQVQLDKELFTTKEALLQRLQALYALNKDQKFLISADKEARHGDVITVLGELRASGFQKVAFNIDAQKGPAAVGSAPAETSAPATATIAAPGADIAVSPTTANAAPIPAPSATTAAAAPLTPPTEPSTAPAPTPTSAPSAADAPATAPATH